MAKRWQNDGKTMAMTEQGARSEQDGQGKDEKMELTEYVRIKRLACKKYYTTQFIEFCSDDGAVSSEHIERCNVRCPFWVNKETGDKAKEECEKYWAKREELAIDFAKGWYSDYLKKCGWALAQNRIAGMSRKEFVETFKEFANCSKCGATSEAECNNKSCFENRLKQFEKEAVEAEAEEVQDEH